jgi:tRNA threonylcarbamoyladenosine biosynthesis protein TsaB
VITLALDASTYRGSVAVLDGARLVVETSVPMRSRDAELLMPAADRALREAGTTVAGVGRVVCGGGPGSFTSLRIAASIAKGLCVGRSVPLYSLSSLALIVAGNVADGREVRRYLATLDALRGESYVAAFQVREGTVSPLDAERLILTSDVARTAESLGARAVGPDLPDAWAPHARGTVLLLDGLIAAGPVDLATWEPRYGRLAEAQVKWEATHGKALNA